MIVSRFAIVAKDHGDLLLSSHQNCQLEVRFRHCGFCTEPLLILVRLQISQFRPLGKWVWILCLPKSSRLISIGSKEASWDELAWEPPCNGISSSTKFSMNSCSHSGISESSEHNGSPRSIGVFFLFVFGFLLAWVSSGRHDLSSIEFDTCTGEMSLSILSLRSWLCISLTVGEEDEVEEGDEEWLSCLEGVFEVDEDPEDELGKPGTTIGTKFSVLHNIRIPSLMRCGFLNHWSIHRNTRFHRKAFRATTLLACYRGLSLSRIYPILWHTQLPLLAFALHRWR